MKKLLLALVAIVALALPAAAVQFTDIPADHWANKAVYGIVKYGVTQGYPDGTFRGTRTINRYELAVFLYNLITAMEARIDEAKMAGGDAASSKAVAELKAEMDNLKADLAAVKAAKSNSVVDGFKTTFAYRMRGRIKNVGVDADSTKLYENRVKVSAVNEINDTTKVTIKFDSQDVNFGAGADLFDDWGMLDAKLETAFDMGLENLVDVTLTTGPGSNINKYNHYDDAVILGTSFAGVRVEAEHQYEFGRLGLSGTLPDFGIGAVALMFDYEVYAPAGANNLFADASVSKVYFAAKATPADKVCVSAKVGLKANDENENDDEEHIGYQVKAKIGDVFDSGTTFELRFTGTAGDYYNDASRETPFRRILFNYTAAANDATYIEAAVCQKLPDAWYAKAIVSLEDQQSTDKQYTEMDFEVGKKINKNLKWFADYYRKADNDESDNDCDHVRTGFWFYF